MKIGLIKKIVGIFLILAILFILSWVFFIINVRHENKLPNNFRCDNVIVLTGDKDRIKLAMNSIYKFKAKNLFISGVYKTTTLMDIFKNQDIGDVSIILGYKAKNTYGNAREIREIAEDLGINEAIIVTSDYHMIRSLYEIKKENPNLKIYPVKVMSEFNIRFLLLSFREFCCVIYMYFIDIFKGITRA